MRRLAVVLALAVGPLCLAAPSGSAQPAPSAPGSAPKHAPQQAPQPAGKQTSAVTVVFDLRKTNPEFDRHDDDSDPELGRPTSLPVVATGTTAVGPHGELAVPDLPTASDVARIHDAGNQALAVLLQKQLPQMPSTTELLRLAIGKTVTVTTPQGPVRGVLRGIDDNYAAVGTANGLVFLPQAPVPLVIQVNEPMVTSKLMWTLADKARWNLPVSYRVEYHTPDFVLATRAQASLDGLRRKLTLHRAVVVHHVGMQGLGELRLQVIERDNTTHDLSLPRLEPDAEVTLPLQAVGPFEVAQVQLAAASPPEYGLDDATDCAVFFEDELISEPAWHFNAQALTIEHLHQVDGDGSGSIRSVGAQRWLGLHDTHAAGALHGTVAQTDCDYDPATKSLTEQFTVTLRNRGNKASVVHVLVPLPRSKQFTIVAESPKASAYDQTQRSYHLALPASSSGTVKLHVKYQW